MKRKIRLIAVLAAVVTAIVTAWLVIPVPFVRGIIVGSTSGVGLVIGAFLVFARRMKKRMGTNLQPPPLPSASWDYAMELTDLEGATTSCSRFSGEVVVLNFWATWCAPCVAEMPGLQRLRDRTSDLDVRFLCVSREERDVVTGFLEKRSIDLPMYLLADDPPDCFTSRAIPATYIIGRNGVIALRHVGAASWDAEPVVTFVRGLAATPAG